MHPLVKWANHIRKEKFLASPPCNLPSAQPMLELALQLGTKHLVLITSLPIFKGGHETDNLPYPQNSFLKSRSSLSFLLVVRCEGDFQSELHVSKHSFAMLRKVNIPPSLPQLYNNSDKHQEFPPKLPKDFRTGKKQKLDSLW